MIYLITKLQPRLGKQIEENDFHSYHVILTLNKKNTFIKIASYSKIFFHTYKDRLF
jgi:hypothetical protein